MAMDLSCCTCDAFRPRYKRLVDNIFPANPNDGIIKNNMEKLIYYANSSPQKLDRIGDYFSSKVARDLYRRKDGYVQTAMDAMDQLLVACNAQSLNLFVESYLKIIQLLLESHEPNMQLLATQSFIRFANIDEDTPSYHRRYDFFVSKFSSLCHDNHPSEDTRRMLRIAGLNGLKGVIRKTVGDDLQVDIWDANHMEKIVPSLLYNMHDKELSRSVDEVDGPTPEAAAVENLRELAAKATFGNIRAVIKPILKHLDNHGLWSNMEDKFAVDLFRLIMESIQNQHSYAVIQILIGHLDDKSKSISISNRLSNSSSADSMTSIKVRTGIATVLANIVAISASDSIGPTVLEIINSLLNYLRTSNNATDLDLQFQETVINALGEFANNLPDYQKIEIMMFIINQVPPISSLKEVDVQLQAILLRSLLKVSTKYHTVYMTQALPSAFLRPLLSISLASEASARLTVQKIFHQLFDRHSNLAKLSKPISLASLPNLAVAKAHRQDQMFFKKHGNEILARILEGLKFGNNTAENYDALYTTLALIFVEISSEEVLVEILRVTLSLQDLAVTLPVNAEQQKAAFHSLVASLCHVCAQMTAIPALGMHVEQVIKNRQQTSSWMLPESERYRRASSRRPSLAPTANHEIAADLLFDKNIINEALRASGHDTTRLLMPIQMSSVVDSGLTRSTSDLSANNLEVDSVGSSPGMARKQPEEELTFASFKKILMQPASADQELRDERRQQLRHCYKTASFTELIARSERKATSYNYRVNEMLSNRVADLTERKSSSSDGGDSDVVRIELSTSVGNNVASYRNKPIDLQKTSPGGAVAVSKQVNVIANPFNQLGHYITFNPQAPPLFAMNFPQLLVH